MANRSNYKLERKNSSITVEIVNDVSKMILMKIKEADYRDPGYEIDLLCNYNTANDDREKLLLVKSIVDSILEDGF